jgi:hypothetical protein
MKHRRGAGEFSMRALGACRSAWHVHVAVQTLHTLHRKSVRCRAAGGRMDERQDNKGVRRWRKGRLRPPQVQVTLPSAPRRSLRQPLARGDFEGLLGHQLRAFFLRGRPAC